MLIMKNDKNISTGFIITIIFFIFGITAVFYTIETMAINNSVIISTKVIQIKAVPRRRILTLQTTDKRFSDSNLFITMPFWSTQKKGNTINIRINPATSLVIGLDKFVYLHKTSLSLLLGSILLLLIISGVFFFKTRS